MEQKTQTSNMIIRQPGLVDYERVWQSMQAFTDTRNASSTDEIWLVEHPPIFTQGRAGNEEHLLSTGDIPVIHVDRGGQVTLTTVQDSKCFI